MYLNMFFLPIILIISVEKKKCIKKIITGIIAEAACQRTRARLQTRGD